MEEALIAVSTLAWIAFALGSAFGFIGSMTNFCTLGAVSDVVNIGDWQRMRMWMLAIGVAVLGNGALQGLGWLDIGQTIYATDRLIWLSHLVGGLCFGVGMTLASGCGSKTLIRIGGGNLKSLVVFVFLGISAYMTMRGLFAVWRVQTVDTVFVPVTAPGTLPALAGAGGEPGVALAVATLLVGGGLAVAALVRKEAWCRDVLLGGIGIGALVVAVWALSGHVGYVEEHPETLEAAYLATNSGRAESLTFVAPIAYTLELLMLWSDTSRIVTIGIAAVLGVIAGSALQSLLARTFRIESFHDAGDLGRHITGGILMGFGGVTAFGCTIGQGITGFSTLSLGAFITTAAIITGAALTMKIQYWLLMRED